MNGKLIEVLKQVREDHQAHGGDLNQEMSIMDLAEMIRTQDAGVKEEMGRFIEEIAAHDAPGGVNGWVGTIDDVISQLHRHQEL